MKKFLISIIALLTVFIVNTTIGRTIVIQKSGMGEGYDVLERHEDGFWIIKGAKSTLICTAPGQHECKFTIDPATLPDMVGPNNSNPEWSDLNDHAKSQIDNNIISGLFVNNVSINGDLWYRSVVWEATDINNYNITIQIELAPTP